MFDIAFVILNYNIIKETVDCVESIIRNIDTSNYLIVVIDNASANSIGIKLNNHYKENENVKVIINNDNLGFAKGNNIGMDLIRHRYGGAKFICCMNNDTLIDQKNIYHVLDHIYTYDNDIGVIGPRIYDRFYLEHSGMGDFLTIEGYKDLMDDTIESRKKPRYITTSSSWKRRLLTNNFVYDINHSRRMLEKKIKQLIQLNSNKKKYQTNILSSETSDHLIDGKYDLILHGCCLIFTPSFFEALGRS